MLIGSTEAHLVFEIKQHKNTILFNHTGNTKYFAKLYLLRTETEIDANTILSGVQRLVRLVGTFMNL